MSMSSIHYISSQPLDLATIQSIILEEKHLKLSNEAIDKIENCRVYLDDKLKSETKPIYGINTGFGSL